MSAVAVLLAVVLIVGVVDAQGGSSGWLNRIVPLIDDVGRRAVQLGVRCVFVAELICKFKYMHSE